MSLSQMNWFDIELTKFENAQRLRCSVFRDIEC